jgi:hypothetical protein
VRLGLLGTSATNWPIVSAPDVTNDECGAVGGMRIRRGNRSPRRKPNPVLLCPAQIPRDLTWDRTRSRRLTAWAIARPDVSYPAIQDFPNISWNQEGGPTTARLLPTRYTNIRKTRINIRVPSGILVLEQRTNHIIRLSPRVYSDEIFRTKKLYNSFMLKLHAGYNKTVHTNDNTRMHWPYADTTGRQKHKNYYGTSYNNPYERSITQKNS